MSTLSSQSLPGLYTWSFPGSPIQICVRLSVVNELQRSLERVAINSGNGNVVGGILFGEVQRPRVLEISGFEALTDLEAPTVEKAMANGPGKAVGFYRPTSVGSLVLREDDLELANLLFRDPTSVVLLIENDNGIPANAAFFFWDQGKMLGDFPAMDFPFDAYQLAVMERQRRPAVGEERKPAIKRPVAAAPVKRPFMVDWRVKLLLLVAVVACGAMGGYLYSFRRAQNAQVLSPSVVSQTARPSLGLNVERRGVDLLFSWNGQAPAVVNATFGMVLIRENNTSRNIPLTADQLRSGSIFYTPKSDEVEIQLNVVSGEKVAKESITAILPQPGTHQVVSSVQAFSVPRPASGAPKASSRDTRQAPAPEPAEAQDAEVAPAAPQPRAFSLPPAPAARAAQAPRLSEPPPAVALNSGPATPSLLGAPLAAPTRPVIPSSAQPGQTGPAPANASSAEPVKSSTAAAPMPRAPVPVHQVVPRFPTQLRSVIVKPEMVEVKIAIDTAGKVSKAEIQSGTGVNPLLAQSALDAARGWTFEPAMINNTAVTSEMILKFNFTPTR